MTFKQLCAELEISMQEGYEPGVTLERAERLASRFLTAMLQTSTELTGADLDSRMRKTGVKTIRAAVYLDCATKGEKKPTEAALAAMVDLDKTVIEEQNAYDQAEVSKAELQRYYDIFREAQLTFRGISKGKYE